MLNSLLFSCLPRRRGPTLADAILDRIVRSNHKIEIEGPSLREKNKGKCPRTAAAAPTASRKAFQSDRGRLRYIEPIACAHPRRIHDR